MLIFSCDDINEIRTLFNLIFYCIAELVFINLVIVAKMELALGRSLLYCAASATFLFHRMNLVLWVLTNPEITDGHHFHLLLESGGSLRGDPIPCHKTLIHRLARLFPRLENHAFKAPTLVRSLITARHSLIKLMHELSSRSLSRLLKGMLMGHVCGCLGNCPGHCRCGALQKHHLILATATTEHAWSVEMVTCSTTIYWHLPGLW